MRRYTAVLVSFVAFLVLGSPARAGVYTDDLAKCLVKSTSADDKKSLIFWVFSGMALHPDVRAYANISDARRSQGDKQVATLLQRVLTQDCRTETVASLKYEGAQAIESAFSVLGQVAMRGLMTDPDVAKGMASVGANLDEAKLEDLMKEAGMSRGANAAPK